MKRLAFCVLAACAQPAQIPADPPRAVAIAPAPAAPAAPDLDDREVIAKSHELLDAMDRADVAAFEAMVAPSFVYFLTERYLDAKNVSSTLQARVDRHSPVHSRTWDEQRVYRTASSAVFIGRSTEHVPPEGDFTGGDRDGFHTIAWIRTDAGWKVASLEYVRKMSKAEYWDDAFKSAWGFRTLPNQLLVDTVKGVRPGTALDLATGQGRNSVFLATQGWKTTGVDVSKVGLELAREQAAKKNVKLDAIEADMEQWDLGKDKWDLVTMIYCGTSHAVVAKVKPSLKKGGLFVTEYFHADSDAGKAGAGGWHDGELKALFSDGYDILRDDVVDDIADYTLRKQKLVRFVARKK
jgi:SAM-dependent methyltransferase